MKGVFKSKPPKPKYACTWNVQSALSFLESLEPLEDLTLKQLSYKTVLLLALTSAARAREISSLDLTYSLKKEGSWKFTLPTQTKTSRLGHPVRKIFLPSFPGNLKKCCAQPYSLRGEDEEVAYFLKATRVSQFPLQSYFQSFTKLCQANLTAGRNWITAVGYTGHSTRGASASAATAAGLSVELILEAAEWASADLRTLLSQGTI